MAKEQTAKTTIAYNPLASLKEGAAEFTFIKFEEGGMSKNPVNPRPLTWAQGTVPINGKPEQIRILVMRKDANKEAKATEGAVYPISVRKNTVIRADGTATQFNNALLVC